MLTAQKLCEINTLRKELFLKKAGEKVAGLSSQSLWSEILEKADLAASVFEDIEYDVRGELCQREMWASEQEMSRFLRSLYGYDPLMHKLFTRGSDYYRDKPYYGRYSENADIYMVPRHTEELRIFDIYIVSPKAAGFYAGDWFICLSPAALCISFVDKLPEEIADKF